MTQCIELQTERLRLRQWQSADKVPFAALNDDPKVMEFFPARLSRIESDAMADRCRALLAAQGWGVWALETQSQEFIGFVGLHIPAAELPFSPCVEIAWRLAAQFWGRGYATEAARAALGVGFDQVGLREIVSFTASINVRSRAVMERLGMRDTKEPFEHPSLPEGHVLRPHCLYRMKAVDYRSTLL